MGGRFWGQGMIDRRGEGMRFFVWFSLSYSRVVAVVKKGRIYMGFFSGGVEGYLSSMVCLWRGRR